MLVEDLFSGEGPHLHVADDFVSQRCTSCGRDVSTDDAQLSEIGHLCVDCFAVALGV